MVYIKERDRDTKRGIEKENGGDRKIEINKREKETKQNAHK